MREYPLFIPHGEEHLAGVLTAPDHAARGLVLLLTGVGAPRSHRFQMWARLARLLADEGLASLRLDYLGMGDSTSPPPPVWSGGWERSLLPQLQTAATTAMEALSVDRMAAIGNCGGAYLSLRLAAEFPPSIGAMCIMLSVLEANSLTSVHRRVRLSSPARWLRRSRVARVVVQRLRGRRPETKVSDSITGLLATSLSNGKRMLALYGEEDREYNGRVQQALDEMLAGLHPASRSRFSMRVVAKTQIGGFEAVHVQDLVIEQALEWLASTFELPSRQIETHLPLEVGPR